ncbi:TadE/TadG family type IV pilus assembly protein [Tianweitania sediminis]|uniref:Pilus assembly protein n=1 Tax=Tianweitania sediminis TaxID=1502156 RepID=A0A8J7R637_9HYPH|nr:TadE/TadG family type IV pilus assembly protein [Tianweitania sediminis]MBP0440560.1 pilus assembly protein [Tianweitania sediminis]
MQPFQPRKRLDHTTPAPRCTSLRGLFRSFRQHRGGSTAIEFVALAIPFSLLVFAILESCLSFAGQQMLSNTADDIARELRTGQLRPAQVSGTKLEDMICERMGVIAPGDCKANLEVDLRQFTSFADAAAVRIRLTADDDIDTSGFAINPGASGTINMLRVFYRWPVITDLMRRSMSNLKGGNTLQFATATWQNEPFDD